MARRTFYHYFESKNDVVVPIARARSRELNRRIDRAVEHVEDPAELIAIALRHTPGSSSARASRSSACARSSRRAVDATWAAVRRPAASRS